MPVHHCVQLPCISHRQRGSETSLKRPAFEFQRLDMFVEIGVGQLDQPLDFLGEHDITIANVCSVGGILQGILALASSWLGEAEVRHGLALLHPLCMMGPCA
jgi:hypothetical protein